MKTAFVILVLITSASHRTAFVLFGQPVSVAWLLAAGEVLAGAGGAWLAVRLIGRFRSWPWLRPAYGTGGESW